MESKVDGLHFTLIAHGSDVILESGSENAQGFDSVARRLPAQLCHMSVGTRKTYTHEGKCFHCVVNAPDYVSQRAGDDRTIVIIVLAANDFSASRAFMFLTDVSKRFKEYDPPTSATTGLLDYKGFDFVVRERMHFYSTNTSIEKIKAAQEKVEDTKRVMLENIDLSINRGEKIENIVSKVDSLRDDAVTYRRQATSTKRNMCLRNHRMCCLIFLIVGIFVLVGLGIGIYFLFKFAPWDKHHGSSSSVAPIPQSSSSFPSSSSATSWSSSSPSPSSSSTTFSSSSSSTSSWSVSSSSPSFSSSS